MGDEFQRANSLNILTNIPNHNIYTLYVVLRRHINKLIDKMRKPAETFEKNVTHKSIVHEKKQ